MGDREHNLNGWNSLEDDQRYPSWGSWTGAVLLNDEIARYANDPTYRLITPFDPKHLKPARYQLHLGDEARIGGKKQRIEADKPLVIQPHQVAIVRTLEHLNIPRFLIARWNLTVDRVYEGLLWVGALQVDPGWVGYLPCPLYNLSDEEVVLHHGDKLFTIDFVRTTPFRPERGCIRYHQDFAVNPALSFFDRKVLRSGPYQALSQLAELRNFRQFAGAALAVLFTLLAAVTGAMGILATRPTPEADSALMRPWWPSAAMMMSFGAFVFSLVTLLVVLYKGRKWN